MLDIHTFANLTRNPSISEISLKLLQDYYEYYLLHHTYEYHLQDGNIVSWQFLEKDFCHLLGIKKIIEKALHPSQHHNYYGTKGYQNVKNGKIDFKHLKKTGGNTRFKSSKDKIVFFFLLHRIVEAPHSNIFVDYIGKPGTRVNVKFLVYDLCESGVGHLGISIDKKTGLYFPQFYMTERINETSNGLSLIEGRKTIGVKKVIIKK
ncbi:PBECR4 domain-containing protein [Cytobacillus sp. Hz8]|uniref:PBECR4 domain-containing protein n=1 Tax=Cytobacillus sp. Hz8 TaxID=3347168 RepID=UPI0035E12830